MMTGRKNTGRPAKRLPAVDFVCIRTGEYVYDGISVASSAENSAPEVGFEFALRWLKRGCRVRRRTWRDEGAYVQMVEPVAGQHLTEPYLCITEAPGQRRPFTPGSDSLLAGDWEMVL